MSILVAGLVGLLLLNLSMQNGAFELAGLQTQSDALHTQQQALTLDVESASSTQHLANKAVALGMVPNPDPVFLNLSDGSVTGHPTPAVAGTPLPGLGPSGQAGGGGAGQAGGGGAGHVAGTSSTGGPVDGWAHSGPASSDPPTAGPPGPGPGGQTGTGPIHGAVGPGANPPAAPASGRGNGHGHG
ncbi:MAG: hypothetical protein ACR2KL_09890 [Nocardioidaceae bacterium]